MGLFDWFPFIRRKGYDPVQLYHTILGSIPTTGRRRFDVLGTSYRIIKDAYSKHPQDIANRILQKEVERFGSHLNMSLYLDGPQAVEKSATAETRESKRLKATEKLSSRLDIFEARIDEGSRIRKQQYIDIKKDLGSSFYWSLESRLDFAEHMRGQEWIVVVCDTEADVRIARDAQPDDITISGDSDMLGYANIHTLWRPVSKSVILVYFLPDMLKTIGLSRAQLTALAVVSKNDYQGNIKGLGPASNFAVIKRLGGLSDPRSIVTAYLSDPIVITKNKHEATFNDSIRVFIDMKQQQVTDPFRPHPTQAAYHALQKRFLDLCQKRESLKNVKGSEAQSRPVDEPIVRLRAPRSFNRYRTVESPANVANNTGAPPMQSEESGHPALARTRIPPHRERFSFQERTRKKAHVPPPRMKQFTLKYYRKSPEATNSKSTPTKPKIKAEKAPTKPKKPLTEMRKVDLVRSLNWRHPSVSLEVGTLIANTKRVFMSECASTTPPPTTLGSASLSPTAASLLASDLQRTVVDCLQECSRLAADKKREAQRLIGVFVETLRVRMDSAEETLRIKLLSEKQTMTEEQRIKARRDALSDIERQILDHLCERIKPKESEDEDEDEDEDAGKTKRDSDSDLDEKVSNQEKFLHSFLRFLYAGSYPRERDLRGFGPRDLLPSNKENDEDKDKDKKKTTSAGVVVNHLIDWLVASHFYKPIRRRDEIEVKMPYTPTDLVRSVAGQLTVELKKMYRNGSYELYKKVHTMQQKGTLEASIDIRIQEEISAVENFLSLNKHTQNSRRIVPFTTSQQPFVSFSERELGHLFWKRDVLKQKLCELALQDNTKLSYGDLDSWIGSKEPGFIIKNFICVVGSEGLTSRKKKKAGHRAAFRMWTLDDIRSHLQQFLPEDEKVKKNSKDDNEGGFHPATYKEKGYALRGSILTDGFRVKLLGFKLRELQDVRYRRWREDRLPSRLTSTVGGTNFYLQEIRNVLTCREDVQRLWPGVDVKNISTLSLDAGQACVFGGFAHLPEELAKKTKGKAIVKDPSPNDMEGVVATDHLDPVFVSTSSAASSSSTMASSLTAHKTLFGSSFNDPTPLPVRNISSSSTSAQPSTARPGPSARPVFFNLAVKTKAVYQPSFKFRRWAQSEKANTLVGESRSVADIETHLPPLRGPSSNVINYIKELELVEDQLKAFYNGPDSKYKRNHWDMQRALHGEFQLIAHRLLGIVGGGLGIRSDPSKPVIIGVGLGKFDTKSGLTSPHSTFLSYFIPLARSLGYIVLGLNEYYTSKKCPACGEFVAQVDLRRFFCPHCQAYHHRDVMAAENMANIIQGYLIDQQRPDYLQPIAPDGTMPWKQEPSSGSSTSSGTVGTSSTTGPTSTKIVTGGLTKAAPRSKRQRKRSSTASSLEQPSSKSARN